MFHQLNPTHAIMRMSKQAFRQEITSLFADPIVYVLLEDRFYFITDQVAFGTI